MQEQQPNNTNIAPGEFSELQEKYFKLAWRIERNKKGLSKPLYDAMYASVYKQYERDRDIYDNTEGLKLDIRKKELESKRETVMKRIELKLKQIKPKNVRSFWHLFGLIAYPNYALELVHDKADIDVEKYFKEQEDELELLRESLDGKPDEEAPADRLAEITAMLENIFPKPRLRRRNKHAKQLRELAEEIYSTLPKEPEKPKEEAPADKTELEKKTRKRTSKTKQDKEPENEPEQIQIMPEPAGTEAGNEQTQEETGTP